jgi:hypothetical protein
MGLERRCCVVQRLWPARAHHIDRSQRPVPQPPAKLTDDDIEAAKAMLANPDIGGTQIAHRLGVAPATLPVPPRTNREYLRCFHPGGRRRQCGQLWKSRPFAGAGNRNISSKYPLVLGRVSLGPGHK